MGPIVAVLLTLACAHRAQPLRISADAAIGFNENECVFYGENYLFALEAPDGWTVDREAASAMGVAAVFYPERGSWEGTAFM